MEARIWPINSRKVSSESSVGVSMYIRPVWNVTPRGPIMLKSCSTTVLVDGTNHPEFGSVSDNVGHQPLLSVAWASLMRPSSLSAVIGTWSTTTPRGASASSMAEAMAAGAPIRPPSPVPFIPL